mmetsp:Transcript_25659/g.59789  ORF Transcript_25659/g.59789 Transcript_25659/m.59789 type:complete len:557 (+) Transcript_25659:129-1799(+)
METALRGKLQRSAPGALDHVQVVTSRSGTLRLQGHVDIRLASKLNLGLRSFLRSHAAQFGLNGEVCRRRLDFRVPQVRLGDVTSEFERKVLARHADADLYSNPENLVDSPEWNADFVGASDRRHRSHIKPRYALDDAETVKAVAAFIADFCRSGEAVVVHTGAGISAAAGVATYREGSSSSIAMTAALPTYAHYALVALTKNGAVDYVCSQNVDGLHRRSGLAAERLSEVHGNSYIETCSCCSPAMEFVRPYDVCEVAPVCPRYWAYYIEDGKGRRSIEANVALTKNERASGIHHLTGRACPRNGGPLRDSIIHFGENLPVDALDEAERRSSAAKLNLVLGCSMLVQPAASLPFKGGIPALVSLTCTGSDVKTLRAGGVLLRAPADAVMEEVVRCLGAFDFPNEPSLVSMLHERVRARDQQVLGKDGDVPYDGGDDGGVVPGDMLARQREPRGLRLRQEHESGEAEGWHQWSLQVEALDGNVDVEGVEEVCFGLHPTFSPPSYVLRKPPFKVGPFLGWGTFDVDVKVKKAGEPVIATSFPLSFREAEKVMLLAAAA